MNKLKLSKEVRVGFLAVVVIFIVYFGMNFLKGVNIFLPIHFFYTQYSHIDGLVVSSPVFIKGYKVGQVEEIQHDFSKEHPFMVKISVSKAIALPQGTVVELFDDGLMGGKALQLIFEPYETNSSMHRSGDKLPSTVSLGMLDKLSATLVPKIENIAAQTDSLLYSLRTIIDNGSVQNSLLSIEKTTAELAHTSTSLRRIVQNDVTGLLTDVDAIALDIKRITTNLSAVDFQSTASNLDRTINELSGITQKISNGEGSLGMLLNDKELYINLSETAESADKLLVDLRKNPRRYVHFSLFGPRKTTP